MPQRLIRNLFDQYDQPENRLTHALVQVLASDAALARAFVRFTTGHPPPTGSSLGLSCQLLPGEAAQQVAEEEYASKRGLPDAWIFDETTGWALVCECKITSGLKVQQLRGHAREAQKRGFHTIGVLAITADESEPSAVSSIRDEVAASWVSWPAVFEFFTKYSERLLASELTGYIRVLEGKLMSQGYEGPPLTKFTGVPFGPNHPYTEAEAKVVLRALMTDLRPRLGRSRVLPPIDPDFRRPALTGAWDIIGFDFASRDDFTRHPHMSVYIDPEECGVGLVLPNNARPEYWRRMRACTQERLTAVLSDVWQRLKSISYHIHRSVQEPQLILDVRQRHFYTRRKSVVDGHLRFDLSPLLAQPQAAGQGVKAVPAWLDAAMAVVAATPHANFQLELQVSFPVMDGSICRKPGFAESLANAAEALHPFLALLRGQ